MIIENFNGHSVSLNNCYDVHAGGRGIGGGLTVSNPLFCSLKDFGLIRLELSIYVPCFSEHVGFYYK